MNKDEKILMEEYTKIITEGNSIPAIDTLKLHEEWIQQPLLYTEYGGALARASELRDLLKDRLEWRKAELNTRVRENKAKKGEKITETLIESLVLQEPEYLEVSNDLRSITGIVSELSVIVKSLDQRKKALEGLVQLYIGEYFSIPKEPKSTEGKFEAEKDEGLKEKQREGLNRRRRK